MDRKHDISCEVANRVGNIVEVGVVVLSNSSRRAESQDASSLVNGTRHLLVQN